MLHSETLLRQFRLRNKGEYKRVFANARKSSDRLFTVLWLPNELGFPRLGLAISKKHLNRAVDRNLTKRLVRESFRKNKDILPAIDIVVLAGRFLKKANNKEIADSLLWHWNYIQTSTLKIGLISNG